MEHYFPNVPGLGNVALSRHAQERMVEDGVSENEVKEALLRGTTKPDGQEVVWREKDGVRVDPQEAYSVQRGPARDDDLPHKSNSEGAQAVECEGACELRA